MKIKYILVCLGLCLLPLHFEHAYASPRAGIAATVNGTMISHLDLEKALQRELYIRRLDKNSAEFKKDEEAIRAAVLNSMIEEKIFLLEAKKQNITISPQQLEAEIKHNIEQSGLSEEKFYQEVAKTGLTKQGYEDTTRNTLTIQTLMSRNVLRKIIVPDEEVLAFYSSRGGNLLSKVEVALIIYPSPAVATKLGPGVQSGSTNFEETAKSVSIGPNAEDGGHFGEVNMTDLAAPIQFQIQKLSQGEVSNIFALGDQEAQVKLLSKGAMGTKPLDVMDEATYEQILNVLRQEKVGTRLNDYVAQLKNKSIIDIRK